MLAHNVQNTYRILKWAAFPVSTGNSFLVIPARFILGCVASSMPRGQQLRFNGLLITTTQLDNTTRIIIFFLSLVYTSRLYCCFFFFLLFQWFCYGYKLDLISHLVTWNFELRIGDIRSITLVMDAKIILNLSFFWEDRVFLYKVFISQTFLKYPPLSNFSCKNSVVFCDSW